MLPSFALFMYSKQALLGRLTRYGLAAGAAGAAANASGAIVVFNSSHALSANTRNASQNWDIDHNGVTDFQFAHFYSYRTGTVFKSIKAIRGAAPNAWVCSSSGMLPKPLPAAATIGPILSSKLNFENGNSVFFSQSGNRGYLNLGTELVGFRFDIAGQTHYGWANITVGNEQLSINNWAYEGLAGVSILAGAVPEPADAAVGLGLLALGAAGVNAYKRWKKRATS